MWLDLVVIGRNEEVNLNALKLSINKIDKLINKRIYVDSASIDNSVTMAKGFFDFVIELSRNEDLSASLGRKIGASFTEKEWILFLDADMELNDQFTEWLLNFENVTSNFGFVGKYKDIDRERNKNRYRVFKSKNGIARYFGGAVLLRRVALFEVGNWSSNIYANEEIELYSRMTKKGYKVEIIDQVMVNHYTEIPNTKEKIMNLFIIKNKKNFIGTSQVFIKAIKERFFIQLFRLQPLPYLLLIFNFLFLNILIFSHLIALIWLISSHILLIIFQKEIKSVILGYIFLYLLIMGLLIQIVDLAKFKRMKKT
ncbi:glycosyltransferase [Psychrobacillus sp. FSL K6-2836]|uniref:glycosyltransferase n=1 Tax=Psychrobacillus sp. FSL K6-2836 TaxID=2921548 RepID=UPI0030FB302C